MLSIFSATTINSAWIQNCKEYRFFFIACRLSFSEASTGGEAGARREPGEAAEGHAQRRVRRAEEAAPGGTNGPWWGCAAV
jgi:hypothetical protein